MITILKSSGKCVLTLLLFMVMVSSAFAQQTQVNGTITDDSGEPIIGANVKVKNQTLGTITDFDGKFMLKVKIGTPLLISYIGYKSQTLPAAKNMKVILKENSHLLNDVVVIGYGVVKKKELTGAVAQVKGDDISKNNVADLGQALQGMISGVSVTSESGAPGAGSNILIRGVTSVSGNNMPLYVVDGVPQEDDPHISPNEIETIDVLKDAASCAIYGTRGASGVILITTKTGKAGKLKVSFDANYGIKNITSQNFLMNSTEQSFVDMMYKRNVGDAGLVDNQIMLDLYRNAKYFHNDTDFMKYVFIDNASTQNYSLNLNGGANGFTYSIVGGYLSQEGNIISSGYDRLNTRANVGYKKDKFTFNASIGLTRETTKTSPSGILLQGIKYLPTQSELSPDDTFITVGGTEQSLLTSIINVYYAKDKATSTSSFANAKTAFELLKGWTVNAQLGYTTQNALRNQFRPYIPIYDLDGLEITKKEDSYIKMTSSNRYSLVWDFGTQYVKAINKHKVTLYAGVTGEEYHYEGFYGRKEGVLNNSLDVLNNGSLNPETGSLDNYVNKLIGNIGRLQYDYKSKYLFTASVRCDGSSKFSSSNRWGIFPSAAVAWNVSDERFFKKLKNVVNSMKLRASYGTVGNQNFSPYSYSASITSGYDYVLNGSGSQSLGLGSIQDAFSNSDVKWETSRQYNVGLDLSMWGSKFTLSAEYYRTNKSNMLFPVTLPGSAGTPAKVTLNVGDMTNNGFELSANYRSMYKKLSYSLGATLGTNSNRITKINGEGTRISAYSSGLISEAADRSQVTFISEGYTAGGMFLYTTNGIANTQEKLAEYQKIVPTAQMGDLIFKDNNNDGKISDDDRRYCGSGLPKYEIGFNLQSSYKGFDLYANIFSALGHKIMNGSKATAFAYGRHKDLVNAYSEFNTDSPVPAYRGQIKYHDNYRGDTDLWLENGSYVRLKNITLGYTIPKALTSRLNINKLRIYLQGQNLITLTKYSGYDPEIGGNIGRRGLDLGNYPSCATYSLGLNVAL